jgi:hypothetical protein
LIKISTDKIAPAKKMADFFGFSPIHVTEFKNLLPKVDFTERDRLKIVSNPVPSSGKVPTLLLKILLMVYTSKAQK